MKQEKNKNKKFLRLSCFLFSFYLAMMPIGTLAAVLYLDPSSETYQPGETFITKIKIDTENECINAVEVNLNYDKDVLQPIDFSQGESLLTFWIKPPEINRETGEVSFSGGIPGGYCGRIPGDPGLSNLLGKIIFKIPAMNLEDIKENSVKVKFSDSSQVLLNDGLGTKAKLAIYGADFKILSKIELPEDAWLQEIKKDNVPPEQFEMEIRREQSIFEGKYFIVFSTVDKQTGLDHYEILETRYKKQEKWKVAESPYLLEDQELESIIKVKAVDKSGNERISEYSPLKKYFPWRIAIIAILWLLGLVVSILILHKKILKKHLSNKVT